MSRFIAGVELLFVASVVANQFPFFGKQRASNGSRFKKKIKSFSFKPLFQVQLVDSSKQLKILFQADKLESVHFE